MNIFVALLCLLLIVCSACVALTKDVLSSILIFMSFSLIMCIIWLLLESPDLAITESAVGAGVTTLLFFSAFKKIHLIDKEFKDGETYED